MRRLAHLRSYAAYPTPARAARTQVKIVGVGGAIAKGISDGTLGGYASIPTFAVEYLEQIRAGKAAEPPPADPEPMPELDVPALLEERVSIRSPSMDAPIWAPMKQLEADSPFSPTMRRSQRSTSYALAEGVVLAAATNASAIQRAVRTRSSSRLSRDLGSGPLLSMVRSALPRRDAHEADETGAARAGRLYDAPSIHPSSTAVHSSPPTPDTCVPSAQSPTPSSQRPESPVSFASPVETSPETAATTPVSTPFALPPLREVASTGEAASERNSADLSNEAPALPAGATEFAAMLEAVSPEAEARAAQVSAAVVDETVETAVVEAEGTPPAKEAVAPPAKEALAPPAPPVVVNGHSATAFSKQPPVSAGAPTGQIAALRKGESSGDDLGAVLARLAEGVPGVGPHLAAVAEQKRRRSSALVLRRLLSDASSTDSVPPDSPRPPPVTLERLRSRYG